MSGAAQDAPYGFGDIVKAASEMFGVSERELRGPGQTRALAHKRFAVMRAARVGLGYSLPRIGRELGRDHTSVSHGLQRADELAVQADAACARSEELLARAEAIAIARLEGAVRCPHCGGVIREGRS